MSRIPWPLLLLVPVGAILQRRNWNERAEALQRIANDGDEAREANGFSGSRGIGVTENYGYAESSDAIPPTMWPDKWVDARAHGRWIAHRLDNETLYDFLYARAGAYEAQTVPLEDYGVPALKMASAIPGWKPSKDQVGQVTVFPSFLALASTWDPYMIQDVATAVAEEFAGLGANVMLGPAINVHRATQHNENFDSLAGEDPTLGSVLTRFWCLAVHHYGIITVPKFLGRVEQVPVHFYNLTANQTAWEIFYPPFQSAVDSGAAGILCDAHEVNGMWACRDFDVLKRDLKDMMGFQGMVISNHGSAMNYFPDPQPTSFERGIDLTLDEPTVLPATASGSAAMQQAAARVLAAIWHLRLDEDGGCKLPCTKELKRKVRSEQHSAVAKRAAASAVVLLKNAGDVLPLTQDKVKTVGLLGPAASELPQEGTADEADYYTGVQEEHVDGVKFLSPAFGLWSRGKAKGIRVTQDLEGADVCIVVGGSKKHHDHWRVDIESVYAIEEAGRKCPKVVVLLEVMGAVLTPWRDKADAIMSIFHAGEETATAWAVTVFGDASPSGKLPISFPLVTEEM
eukprot:CAMPEP_0171214936 /NCGR_PEP_ID=MMETSP0790-20130122/31411_1 /TAXON_ID=2925 /ORGANISM="Alexandrium catenella, Strain OF101" /LENGTH=569 /DNA_ID=CAMNT_0011680679 /DNA_START=101 /DNA_END=1807 /DNA_ORIENTATION=+